MVRTAHFTTKIEQNKLKYKEVEQVYKNYKKDPLTIKQKAQLEVRNVFEAYEFIYDLDPGKYFTDMDETILKKIQQLLMDAFSVEEYFDKRIEDYYDTLMLATQGDLKPFIIFYLECVISSLTKVLNELLRFDRIKHIREVLGKGHAKTMFELIARMEDGEAFHRQLFDETLDASSSSIAKNLSKLKELDVIKHGDERGEYIVSIVE